MSGFTDEQMEKGVGLLSRPDGLTQLFITRLADTIARLQRERDEARRVARKLGEWLMGDDSPLNGAIAESVETALAYPEQDSTKET